MPDTLANRSALVTGASRGIGKAIAIALAEAGANVAVNYRAQKAQADATVEAIKAVGKKSAAFQADVSRSDQVATLINQVEQQLGPIDIPVNNAGHALTRSIDQLTEEDFDRTIATNLKSAFLCSHAVFKG